MHDDLDAVIDRISDSLFGLGGAIWTSSPDRGSEVALLIEAGTVRVNKHLDIPSDISLCDAEQSGFGREQGVDGTKVLTQAMVINVAKGNSADELRSVFR